MASPLQPFGVNSRPSPALVLRRGTQAEGGRAQARYVHKIGTSPKVLVFKGSTAGGVEKAKRNRRDALVDQVVGSLNRCGREKQAKALATCGEWFDVWHKEGGQVRLLPCPCDSMFCPDCANRRSMPLIKKLSKMVNRPGRSYWFLTLTVPNVSELSRSEISKISDKFGELWRSWVFQGFEDECGVTHKIFGGVRSIECVRSSTGAGWHPHIHILFEAPKRLPWWWLILLKHAWLQLTGDARYVRLQRAHSTTKRGKKKYNYLNAKALREVCKYVTKCAEFAGSPLLVDEFLTAFKGVRRTQCFGSFHGAKAAEFDRVPGEDDAGISETEQRLSGEGYSKLPFKAHVSDTVLAPDGTRQLTFAFAERVREYVMARNSTFELTPFEPKHVGQSEIGFSGPMPAESELQL